MPQTPTPTFGVTSRLRALAVATALAFAAQPAAAAIVTTLPDGVAQPFPVNARQVNTAQKFGDGVTYRGTTLNGAPANSYFGYTGSFTIPTGGAGTNWGGGAPFAAVGLSDLIMTFSFDNPVAGVLAEFAWSRAVDKVFTLSAYGSNGALLERLSFSATDPAYSKGFFGFERATNDISRFEVQGYYYGVRNLSTFTSAATGAVPEPATWGMMILGFGLSGAMLRARRRSASLA